MAVLSEGLGLGSLDCHIPMGLGQFSCYLAVLWGHVEQACVECRQLRVMQPERAKPSIWRPRAWLYGAMPGGQCGGSGDWWNRKRQEHSN